MDIIVPNVPFWHKLLIYLFFQKFEKWFIICAKILINLKVQESKFEPQTFHDSDLKLKQSRHIRLFHNIDKTMFIIIYNHYLPKFSNKKQGAKVMISNLNNYSTICCHNGKGTMVMWQINLDDTVT
jgi:hypothetical protein